MQCPNCGSTSLGKADSLPNIEGSYYRRNIEYLQEYKCHGCDQVFFVPE